MDDAAIIQLYWERNEQAICETDKKYGKLCFQLADNILKIQEDTEECVSDTFFKVWNSIPDDRPEHFAAYLCRITKRLALSKYRYNMAQKRQGNTRVSYDELAETALGRELSEIVSGKENPEDMVLLKELSDAISNFLMRENVRNRQIFVRRYWYYDSLEAIAETFRTNPRTVGSSLCRMRKRLKKYLQKEGYPL